MKTCACCGVSAETESHHVGRREHSNITLNACESCHNAFTIADVHERDWTTGGPLQRVGLGLLDVIARTCENWELFEHANVAYNVIAMLQTVAGFKYRPSAGMATEPETGMIPGSVERQIREISKAYAAWCETTGLPVTDTERFLINGAQLMIKDHS